MTYVQYTSHAKEIAAIFAIDSKYNDWPTYLFRDLVVLGTFPHLAELKCASLLDTGGLAFIILGRGNREHY